MDVRLGSHGVSVYTVALCPRDLSTKLLCPLEITEAMSNLFGMHWTLKGQSMVSKLFSTIENPVREWADKAWSLTVRHL